MSGSNPKDPCQNTSKPISDKSSSTTKRSESSSDESKSSLQDWIDFVNAHGGTWASFEDLKDI